MEVFVFYLTNVFDLSCGHVVGSTELSIKMLIAPCCELTCWHL